MADEIVTTDAQQSTSQAKNWVKLGLIITTLVLVTLVGVLGFNYFKMTNTNTSLTDTVTRLQQETRNNQQTIETLQKSITELQQSAQKSQELSDRQEKMIIDWQAAQKGNLEKWFVAEAQYLTKLASDNLQFTHNIALATTLLQRADQVLQNQQDGNLIEIRKSLTTDISSLQATPFVDTTELYLRLNALNEQLDNMPLPASPLKSDANQHLQPTDYTQLPWWKAGLARTWDSLRKVVIVRNSGYSALPLVMPEEKTYFYQNLHSQMESAMWAVLNHNAAVYQASLQRLYTWSQKYLDQDADATKSLLNHLQELQRINLQPSVVNLSGTLQQFDNYFAQADKTQTAQ